MALLPIDRDLLQRCLAKQPGAWNDFVDRFLSLVYHVVNYTAHLRSVHLAPEDVEDIAAEVLLQIVADDYKVLRQFRGQANLATYLTVIARRICVHELNRRQTAREAIKKGEHRLVQEPIDDTVAAVKSVESLDEVERLLRRLKGREREVVRLFYLEGRTYEEISIDMDLPVNTIGAALSRARKRLRDMNPNPPISNVELPALKAAALAEDPPRRQRGIASPKRSPGGNGPPPAKE